jgi:hypothetical protein
MIAECGRRTPLERCFKGSWRCTCGGDAHIESTVFKCPRGISVRPTHRPNGRALTRRSMADSAAFIKTGWTWIARITHQAAARELLCVSMNTLERAFNFGARPHAIRIAKTRPAPMLDAQIEMLFEPLDGFRSLSGHPKLFCISPERVGANLITVSRGDLTRISFQKFALDYSLGLVIWFNFVLGV